jgi:hypothetical protein
MIAGVIVTGDPLSPGSFFTGDKLTADVIEIEKS